LEEMSARRLFPGPLLLAVVMTAACGADAPTPVPSPSPQEDWLAFAVTCAPPGCSGLTNAEIDRSVTPARARLRVGQQTSLRAVALGSCPQFEEFLDVRNWAASDPTVIKVEASSYESAIVTALGPGVSAVRAERVRPDGTISTGGLRDAAAGPTAVTGCVTRPEVRIEVVP
jgi:hypothetical protein